MEENALYLIHFTLSRGLVNPTQLIPDPKRMPQMCHVQRAARGQSELAKVLRGRERPAPQGTADFLVVALVPLMRDFIVAFGLVRMRY